MIPVDGQLVAWFSTAQRRGKLLSSTTALHWPGAAQHWTKSPWCLVCREDVLLGTANSSRSFKLFPSMSVMKGRLLLPMRCRIAGRSWPLTPLTPFGGTAEGMVEERARVGGDARTDELHGSYSVLHSGVRRAQAAASRSARLDCRRCRLATSAHVGRCNWIWEGREGTAVPGWMQTAGVRGTDVQICRFGVYRIGRRGMTP
jgi:hypothetical protein